MKITEVVGLRYGKLTVINELEPHITPNGSKQRIVRVKCECGEEYVTRLTSAKKREACPKCNNRERRKDITGQRFGRLSVESMASDYISPSGYHISRCNCRCDCGKICVVNMNQLITGQTKSCGCLVNKRGLLKDNEILMQEYDYERNQDLDIDFETITARNNKKVWWKCRTCGRSWLAQIASRNDDKKYHGCPYCSGRLVIPGSTDLLTQYPDVAIEWDYEKNTSRPSEVASKSSHKVWWRCKNCGWSWKQTIANRTFNHSGCPKCNIENVNSFCEQAVYYYIKQAFPDAINGDMHIGMELDIYIPSVSTAIEYDGEVWHEKEKKANIDEKKNQLCAEKGIRLFRIREPRLKDMNSCFVIRREDSTTAASLNNAIEQLIFQIGGSDISVDTDRDSALILEQFAVRKYNNSLAECYPDIAKEWNFEKNGNLTPEKVSKGARRKVWWKCDYGHEYIMAITERTRPSQKDKCGKTINPRGCPYCSGKRVALGFNDLESRFPKIASEWHPIKNGKLKPTEVLSGSSKKVWWLGKCGHEWEQSIDCRTGQNQGCPICYKTQKSPAVICVESGEVFNNAMLAAEWANVKWPRSIYKCCRGEQKIAGGYHWKYANNIEETGLATQI